MCVSGGIGDSQIFMFSFFIFEISTLNLFISRLKYFFSRLKLFQVENFFSTSKSWRIRLWILFKISTLKMKYFNLEFVSGVWWLRRAICQFAYCCKQNKNQNDFHYFKFRSKIKTIPILILALFNRRKRYIWFTFPSVCPSAQ